MSAVGAESEKRAGDWASVAGSGLMEVRVMGLYPTGDGPRAGANGRT